MAAETATRVMTPATVRPESGAVGEASSPDGDLATTGLDQSVWLMLVTIAGVLLVGGSALTVRSLLRRR